MERDGIIATYIMASGRNGTLYVGVTSDLWTRVYQHRHGLLEGFSKTYGCKQLVWYQSFELITNAIRRENTIKGWPRAWKLNAIEAINPDWRDLADAFWNPGIELRDAGFPEQVRE